MTRATLLTSLLLPIAFAFAQSRQTIASPPCVQFDVVQVAEAVDASTPEFLKANPNEKLIRIRLPISSLVHVDSEDSLLQYLYLLTGSTTPAFQIVDYMPKTTLTSDIAGEISIERSTGNSSNVGAKASGPHELPVHVDASASRNVSSTKSKRLQKLPEKHLLAASGTLHRGISAYFKLKPSSQTTLEGDKTFEITARVPYNWRAGLLEVDCAAFARALRVPARDPANVVCGRSRFVVGIYISGDEVAKHSVWRLSETQQALQSLARRHSADIADQRFPTFGHKLGAALSVVKPRIPDHWLDQLLNSDDYHNFERHLPRKVRMAATEYREARRQVNQFAG